MLPKKNRVETKIVDKIFKEGKSINANFLAFKFIQDKEHNSPRISFIASKNVAKLAVGRNLLRRRGYKALEKYIEQFPAGILGVFLFKKSIDSVLEIENEIEKILRKIN